MAEAAGTTVTTLVPSAVLSALCRLPTIVEMGVELVMLKLVNAVWTLLAVEPVGITSVPDMLVLLLANDKV